MHPMVSMKELLQTRVVIEMTFNTYTWAENTGMATFTNLISYHLITMK